MKHFDAIRGKKPTKTELILEYLVNHPNRVLTPKEIAEGLDFNLQTTVTVLNRLALEGAISKKGRGQFFYDLEGGKKLKEKRKTSDEKTTSRKIDKKTAETIYKAIYIMASESTGSDIVGSVTGLSLNDFDEKQPVESIKNLVRALIDLLGEEIADDIVSIALEKEPDKVKSVEFKSILAE